MEVAVITTRAVGDHTVVHVAGEIDLACTPEIRQRLIDLVRAGGTTW